PPEPPAGEPSRAVAQGPVLPPQRPASESASEPAPLVVASADPEGGLLSFAPLPPRRPALEPMAPMIAAAIPLPPQGRPQTLSPPEVRVENVAALGHDPKVE